MKTTWTRHVAGVLSAIVLSASPVGAVAPMILTNLSGTVHIQQQVPCGNPVDLTTTIMKGQMAITPHSTRDGVLFDLTTVDMFLTPFSVQRDCRGIRATADFREIGIRLAGAVRFLGEETGGLGSRLYKFTIPKEQFRIYESVLDNAPVPQPETKNRGPSENVTGLIDLNRRTVQLHVVLTAGLHFRAGCVGNRCRIDEMQSGTQTADIVAVTATRPMPPTVTCTAVTRSGDRFRVFAENDSGTPPSISIGSYLLTSGEVIQLQQTRQPGVRLLETNRADGMRHFQVGPGEAFIIATSSAGLSAMASCP